MKRVSKVITGEYCRNGYTVLLCHQGGVRAVYSAGNNPHDSQQPASVGVNLRQMRAFCMKTSREIATERRVQYGGVMRVCEEDLT